MFEFIPEPFRPGLYFLVFIVVWVAACYLWTSRVRKPDIALQKPPTKHVLIAFGGLFAVLLIGVLISAALSLGQ